MYVYQIPARCVLLTNHGTFFFTDVNECLLNNGNCSQNCTDTIGSYTCSCYVGYTLNDDRRTCAGKEINKVLKELFF